MSGKRSKDKGKRGERDAAAKMSALFGVKCRRGQQFCGGADSPDVVGLPGIHLEDKRTERLELWKAINQAATECGENIPMVLHKPNDRPWIAIVELDRLPALVTKLYLILAAQQ